MRALSIYTSTVQYLPDTALEEASPSLAIVGKLALLSFFAIFCTFRSIVAINVVAFLKRKIIVSS
jgi:hypothetical protein